MFTIMSFTTLYLSLMISQYRVFKSGQLEGYIYTFENPCPAIPGLIWEGVEFWNSISPGLPHLYWTWLPFLAVWYKLRHWAWDPARKGWPVLYSTLCSWSQDQHRFCVPHHARTFVVSSVHLLILVKFLWEQASARIYESAFSQNHKFFLNMTD